MGRRSPEGRWGRGLQAVREREEVRQRGLEDHLVAILTSEEHLTDGVESPGKLTQDSIV